MALPRSAMSVLTSALRPGPSVPGWLATPRLVLLAALAALYLLRRPDDTVVWWPALALLVATAVEGLLRRLLPRRRAVHLPGLSTPVVLGMRSVVGVALAALAVLAVAAVAAAPPWVVVAAAVVQVLTVLVALGEGTRSYAARPAAARALRDAVVAYAPEFVVYTARRGGLYQLAMWLPHLEALGRRYVVVTRDAEALEPLSTVTDSPVLACPSWRDLDSVVVPSLRAAFYVNSLAANADFVTYRQLVHVYLGHGESDKALSHHPAHAMYDRIFVSGRAAVERYSRAGVVVPPEKFVVVGLPQSGAIHPARGPVADTPEPAVLYAPTWQGYNDASMYSSLPRAPQIVERLLRRPGTVEFRPHPFSLSRSAERRLVEEVEELLRRDVAQTGRGHRWGVSGPFAASANRADAMVADLSSVVTEFLASGKPFALVVNGDVADFRERHPVAQAAYLVDAGLANLDTVLDELLDHDALRERRAELRRYYVGADTEAAFREAVEAVLERPVGGERSGRSNR